MAIDYSILSGFKSVGDYDREREAQALQQQLMQAKLSSMASGRDLPAPIQVANEMFRFKQMALDETLDLQTRATANNRFNLLGQAAKTYGFAPGVQYDNLGGASSQSYAPQPYGSPVMPQSQPIKVQPMSSPQAADTVLGLFGGGNETGMSGAQPPAMIPTLAQAPAPEVIAGVSSIPGFDDTLARRGATIKGAEKQSEKDVELRMNPDIAAAEVAAKQEAEFATKGRQGLIKAQRALQSKEMREDFLQSKIDSIAERANGFTTGFGGSLTGAIPGTPAFNLRKDVQTLLANAGFDRLQEMRDNSVTGGALGNVTEIELELLQASAQALMASQSKEQFIENLRAFQQQRLQSLANVKRAYEEDYARFGGQADKSLPAPNASPAALPNTPQKGDIIPGVDGDYMFNGGNPADKANYKKVR
jgi:hypothetical protein